MAETPYRHLPADLLDHPKFARMSDAARMVHLGLRAMADHHGRAQADAWLVSDRYFRWLGEEGVQAALDENVARGWMLLYVTDGIQWAWFSDTDSMHKPSWLERERPRSSRPVPPGYQDPRVESPPRSPDGPPRSPDGPPRSPDGPPRSPDGPPSRLSSREARSKEQGVRLSDAVAARVHEAGPGSGAGPGSPPEAGPELLAVVEAPQQPTDAAPVSPEPPPPSPPEPEPEEPVPRDPRFASLRPFAERWRAESHYPETADQVVSFAARVERERGHPVDWALVVERANGRAGPRGRKVESASAVLLRWVDTADKAREFEPGREVAHGRQRPEKAGGGAGRGKRNHTCDFPNDWGNRLDELA